MASPFLCQRQEISCIDRDQKQIAVEFKFTDIRNV